MSALLKYAWRVTRNCCRDGKCRQCRMYGKPARVVQAKECSESFAKRIARQWAEYGARVEPMPARRSR